jgi:hypothetical protein
VSRSSQVFAFDSLVIHAPPRDREVEAQKAKERSIKRFCGEATA